MISSRVVKKSAPGAAPNPRLFAPKIPSRKPAPTPTPSQPPAETTSTPTQDTIPPESHPTPTTSTVQTQDATQSLVARPESVPNVQERKLISSSIVRKPSQMGKWMPKLKQTQRTSTPPISQDTPSSDKLDAPESDSPLVAPLEKDNLVVAPSHTDNQVKPMQVDVIEKKVRFEKEESPPQEPVPPPSDSMQIDEPTVDASYAYQDVSIGLKPTPTRRSFNMPPKIKSSKKLGSESEASDGELKKSKEAEKSDTDMSDVEKVEGDEKKEIPLHQMTMAALIASKFNQGKLSKAQEAKIEARKLARRNRRGKSVESDAGSVTLGMEGPSQPVEPVKSPLASPETAETTETETPADIGPRLRVVNGEIQIDFDSLIVRDESGHPFENDADRQVVEERAERHITSATFRRKAFRMKWSTESTERFYEGLSYFGTDFTLVSHYIRAFDETMLVANLDRKHVKSKFNAENRQRSNKVTHILIHKKVPGDDVWTRMKECVLQSRNNDTTASNPVQQEEEDNIALKAEQQLQEQGVSESESIREGPSGIPTILSSKQTERQSTPMETDDMSDIMSIKAEKTTPSSLVRSMSPSVVVAGIAVSPRINRKGKQIDFGNIKQSASAPSSPAPSSSLRPVRASTPDTLPIANTRLSSFSSIQRVGSSGLAPKSTSSLQGFSSSSRPSLLTKRSAPSTFKPRAVSRKVETSKP